MAFDPSFSGFSIVDYVVFFAILIGSLGIGVYHCFRSNKTTEDFLHASRSMSLVPVTLSLIATFISSISILGYVGEVYGHGLQMMWTVPGSVIGMMIAAHVFMPVIFSLKLSSINEYLELRFRSPVLKYCVLVQTIISCLLYLGICLYAPTLALEAVTPLKSSTYIFILGIIVTLYSSIGGLKAVVWTDALQSIMILVGILIASVSSIVTVGGLDAVWKISANHSRTDALDMGFGLYTRHTVFNTLMTGVVFYTNFFSFNQSVLQRVSTMPDLRRVKLLFNLNCLGLVCLSILLYGIGLSVFAVYADCDPISLGYISRKDQIFPYYVMDHLGYMKGVPGAFVACLFSGTMSSISSVLNSVPSMIWSDVLAHISFFERSSEKIRTLTNKVVSLCMGLIMISLAFMASYMDGLIQASLTVQNILNGPIIGVFLMGFCIPICGKKGALSGFILSMLFMTWLGIGSQLHGVKAPMLPLSIAGCKNDTSAGIIKAIINTSKTEQHDIDSKAHPLSGLYGISYTFLSPIGILICLIVGVLVSLIAERGNPETVDSSYLLGCFRKYGSPQHSSKQFKMKNSNEATVVSEQTELKGTSIHKNKNNIELNHASLCAGDDAAVV